jgi:hypothetical protein
MLEAVRAHAPPGREAATVNGILSGELRELLLRDPPPEPLSARVLPFHTVVRHRG